MALYADANQDGVPDSTTPISGSITLAPYEEFHFVARLHVPAGTPLGADGAVRIDATSVAGSSIAPVNDRVHVFSVSPPCQIVDKSLSASRGPSPAGPITVTLHFHTCDKALSRLVISDLLPASMQYVAGSARSTFTATTALTDAIVGNDRQGTGAVQVGYDFNQTAAGTATATIYALPADTDGAVTFQVDIAPGLAVGTLVPNTATYVFYDPAGNFMGGGSTDTITYTVDSRVDLRLTGERIASATPGATTTFTNVLTNLGDAADTFDVTLTANTFPPGTTVALFKPDGVTPLTDTDGDGVPDTGPVPPGASVNIVVKVTIPETAPPGSYKVTKTARSARAPVRSASTDDSVDTVASRCAIVLDPDNQALIGRGQHIVYTHFLTNHGNCRETVTAKLDFLGDSVPGWTSSAYIDNPVAGRGSIPGVVDATDTPVVMGWSREIGPGESLRVLLDVRAPGVPTDAKRAKQTSPTDTTTLVITGLTVGALVVHDTTLFDDADMPAQPANVIRNFEDATYQSPTVWGVIGRSLFLRADAPSCNADPTRVETRTVVITGPNGEHEEVTATETGADTGIFVVPALPARRPPVVAGDNVLEGNANDTFDVQVLGCGQHIANVVTLMEASSVVFDSRTNEPIAGATVTLVGASGGRCTTIPASFSGTGAQNPVTTGSDGRFSFPAIAGDYCLAVKPPNGYRFPSRVEWPLQPRGHNLDVTGLTAGGSYGNPFRVSSAGVIVDVPLDPAAQDGLFVQKDASRQVAEIGDFVDYSVQVN
ncbi:MAG TPA: hypothetical protein VKQ07_01890, partial [Jatrophihabitantaceae bacterium]|nr:hypothetical protein [Jatrophihabitantaceae bacterium]